VDAQRFNNPRAHGVDLRSVLRYVGKGDAVTGVFFTNPLNQLTEASSKVEARLARSALRFNVPTFGRSRAVAQEINVPTVIGGEAEPLKMLLDRSLHKCLTRKLSTEAVATLDRHDAVSDA